MKFKEWLKSEVCFDWWKKPVTVKEAIMVILMTLVFLLCKGVFR